MWQQLKILKHADTISSVIGDDISLPIHVEIEPAELCNHRCIFCNWYDKSRKELYPNMDFTGNRLFPIERLLTLIDELADIGTKAISFTGAGDPLMHPDIYEVFKRVVKNGMEYAVTSNLNMGISSENIDILNKASWIRCSMNASRNPTYKRIHKAKSSINTTIENIKSITSPVNISFVITEGNKTEIEEVAGLSKYIGAKSISFRPDTILIRNDEHKSYDDYIITKLEKAKRYEDETFKVYQNMDRLDERKPIVDDLLCYYSNHSIYIAVNGDVYPCCMTRCDKKFVIGNISDTDFVDFWYSKDRVDNYRKLDMRYCPPCRHEYDNRVLSLLYNEDGVSDNFI